jgi:DNA-binding transcriptional ArsR family regulator
MVLALPVAPPPTDVFRALSDPTRWTIICEMARVDELACTTLENLLPISKPTISYHIKVLFHAGLIEVRKQGRHYFYILRRETLDGVLTEIAEQVSISLNSSMALALVPAGDR